MTDIPVFLKTPRVRKAGIAAGIMAAVYLLTGFFVLPGIIKGQIIGTLREQTRREATVQQVKFNPLLLALTVNGFDLKDPDGETFVSFGQFFVDFELSSLFYRAYTFREIRLVSPYGRAHVLADGKYNFSDLLDQDGAEKPAVENTGGKQNLPAVRVQLLDIQDGKFIFRDQSHGRDATAEFGPVQFTVREFSTRPREGSLYSFSAETTRGEKIDWEGSFLLDPLGSEGRFTLGGIQLRPLWEYMRNQTGFEVRSGNLTVSSKYGWDRSRGLRLTGTGVGVTGLIISEKGTEAPVIEVPDFQVRNMDLMLDARTIRIPVIESASARISVIREPGGGINLARMFAPVDDGTRTSDKASPPPAAKDAPSGKPWKVTLDALRLDDYAISFEDRTTPVPATIGLNSIKLQMDGVVFPLEKEFGLSLSLKTGETGSFETRGNVGLKPLSVSQEISLAGFPLPPLQPYLDPHLNLQLKAGLLNASGQVKLAALAAEKGGKTSAQYAGTVSVAGLRAVDTRAQEDLVRWDALRFNGMDVATEPLSVKIDEIVWEKPYSRVVIRKDQTTNLTGIVKEADAAPAEPASTKAGPAQPPVKASIRTVRFVDGSANFSDYSLEPGFTAGIYALNGAIKGLSSSNTGRANVDIRGKVDRYAPVLISGQINPLSSNAYTDVTLSFQGIEVSSFTPYSSKYAGYLIDKGKIYLDLRYRLNQRKLVGENKVMIDQFTFGEKTNSPDATSLPVKLAVAILKDREGKINIDLPVRGDLDDPDFRYGRVIWAALKTLLEKVASAPFTALASLIVGAGGDQLGHVDFPAGRLDISPEEQGKFPSIAKLLDARPVLRIEVKGRASVRDDTGPLKEQKLLARLRADRADEIKGRGGVVPDPNAIILTETDEARLLRKAYQETFRESPRQVYDRLKAERASPDFPKESSADGLALVTEAIRTRLIAAQTVDMPALRELAQVRASRVQAGLIEGGGIDPTRVFVREVEVADASPDAPADAAPVPAGSVTVPTELLLTAD